MLCHIVAQGRLVRDPELRYTQSGVPVCSFSIACERDYKDSEGHRPVDYLDIVAFRQTASFASQYLTKGRLAIVDGRLQLREWIDKEGNKRRSAEIVANNVHFGDSKPQNQAEPVSAPAPAAAGAYSGGYASATPASDLDEPF